MDRIEWQRKLLALRDGKLRIEKPGESGMTSYATDATYEMKQYITALECGYREVYKELAGYRAREEKGTLARLLDAKERLERANAEMLENQWSESACLGYAAMAMRQSGMLPSQVVGLLELMCDLMDQISLRQAAEAHQALLDGSPWTAQEAPGGDEI